MIKAVIFDWGGVLIDNPEKLLLEHCARTLGVKAERLKEALSRFRDGFTKGTLPENEMWKRACLELGVREPSSPSLWKEAVHKVFVDREDVYEMVKALRRGGYKTGLLSNTELPTMEYFHEGGYGKYFDAAVFSCAEGIAKPDERIYRIALERLCVEPEEAAFIDDKEEFVKAAEKLGMKGIVFRSAGQLKEALSSLSVNPG